MDKTTDDELIPKSTDEAVKVADEEDEVIESVLTKARQTLVRLVISLFPFLVKNSTPTILTVNELLQKDTVEIRDMGTVICEELHQQNSTQSSLPSHLNSIARIPLNFTESHQ